MTHSNRGDRVVDLFIGSGTTPELATKWRRKFAGCEMNPAYFDVALKRSMFQAGGYPEAYEDFNDYEEDEDLVREFVWNQDMEEQYTADMNQLCEQGVI